MLFLRPGYLACYGVSSSVMQTEKGHIYLEIVPARSFAFSGQGSDQVCGHKHNWAEQATCFLQLQVPLEACRSFHCDTYFTTDLQHSSKYIIKNSMVKKMAMLTLRRNMIIIIYDESRWLLYITYKAMAVIFWNARGIIHIDYLQTGK